MLNMKIMLYWSIGIGMHVCLHVCLHAFLHVPAHMCVCAALVDSINEFFCFML